MKHSHIFFRMVNPWEPYNEYCFKAVSIELAADMQCEAYHQVRPSTTGMKVFTGSMTKDFTRVMATKELTGTTTADVSTERTSEGSKETTTTEYFSKPTKGTKMFTTINSGTTYENPIFTATQTKSKTSIEGRQTPEMTQHSIFENRTTTTADINGWTTSLESNTSKETPSAGSSEVAADPVDAALNIANGALNTAADAAGAAADVAANTVGAAADVAGAAANIAGGAAGAAVDVAGGAAGGAFDVAGGAVGAAADTAVNVAGAALGAISGVFGS